MTTEEDKVTYHASRGLIYLSGEARGIMADEVGRAHYSYRFVEDGYHAAFRRAGFAPIDLEYPEFFSRACDLPNYVEDARPGIHIAVRPTESIRLCRPLYNIQMFAWEFDVLRIDELQGDNPFENQFRMLSIVDEVWTLSRYSQQVLRSNGVKKVRVVPGPVKFDRVARLESGHDRVRGLERLSDCDGYPLICYTMSNPDSMANTQRPEPLRRHKQVLRAVDAGSLFVSVLNPHDLRKNFEALVLGFHAVASRHETAVLVVKLNLPLEMRVPRTLSVILRQLMPHPTSIATDRIILLLDFLDDDKLSSLYSAASFYLSATLAEGQNLPLQEAMLHGCVAVAPIHTAMLDYLDEDNCVVVASERVRIWTDRITANQSRRPFEVSRPRIVDVARAVKRALGLTESELDEFAHRGAERIEQNYSIDTVSHLLAEIHDEIVTVQKP